MDETMLIKVISELKSVSRLKIFFEKLATGIQESAQPNFYSQSERHLKKQL